MTESFSIYLAEDETAKVKSQIANNLDTKMK